MFDRRSRFVPIKTETPPKVGPTTYNLPELFERTLEGYAPFLTLCDPRASKDTSSIPAPNRYYPKLTDHIKGGSSLSYTDDRFKYVEKDGSPRREGPILNPEEFCQTKAADSAEVAEGYPPKPRQVHGKLYLFKAIAGKRLEDIQEGPRKKKYGPGPATYFPNDQVWATELYRGNFWSHMKGERGLVLEGVSPGPADYDVDQRRPTPFQLQLERVREQRRRSCYLPRTSQLIDHKARLENLPGPGQYDLPDQLGRRAPAISQRSAFLSSDKRFKYEDKKGPGPADTIDPRTAMDSLKKPRSESRRGVFAKAPRFIVKFEGIPGPGAYNIPGLREELKRKMPSIYSRRMSAFSSTAERPLTFVLKDAPLIPGPGAYIHEKEYPKGPGYAIFRSRIERFVDIKTGIPPLGSYNDLEADSKARNKCVYKKGQVTSYLARFGPLTNVVYKGPARDAPSPSNYMPVTKAIEKKEVSVVLCKSPRFKDKPFGPGPAAYHINPLYGDSVLRGTFNVTLDNPVPRERPPEVPWKIKKIPKKKLRWFYEKSKYVHCHYRNEGKIPFRPKRK